MWDPPPDTYETARDFIALTMEKMVSPFTRKLKPWNDETAGYIRGHVANRGYLKDQVVSQFCSAWTHVVNQNVLIQKLREENERLSAKVIADHEVVIELHREIKNAREQEIEGLKSVIETAVDTSMKKSYSEVTATVTSTATPALDTRVMRKVVQDATEADMRAKNLIVFGLPESAEEDLKESVSNVLDAVGEKPNFEVERVGKTREGKIRPVLVKLRSTAVAAQIRRKAGKLKKTEMFSSVFICPDRTQLQRREHKACVEELKKRCNQEPNRLHVIRDGTVISMDKDKGSRENG